jgi:hypothetical protein
MKITWTDKVAGVSFRDETVHKTSEGDKLTLTRERHNLYDSNAVRVDWNGEQLGYVPKARNTHLAKLMDSAVEVEAVIHKKVGGHIGKENNGIIMMLSYEAPDIVLEGFEEIKTFTGDVIYFDRETHTYYNGNGEKLKGGSTFASEHMPQFPEDLISKKVAKQVGLKQADILDLWNISQEVNSLYGSLLHKAIELYTLHRMNMEKYDDNRELDHDLSNWMVNEIAEIVSKLPEEWLGIPEVVVSSGKKAGTIDSLIPNNDDTYTIVDYKSNEISGKGKPKKPYDDWKERGKLAEYTLQLNYYKHILEEKGFKVRDIKILNYQDKKWTVIDIPKKEIYDNED